jgi:hypothetical protein
MTSVCTHQPLQIGGAGGGSYQYDGNLRRVKEVTTAATVYSVYDRTGALVTRHNLTTGIKEDYLSVGGQTIATQPGGEI